MKFCNIREEKEHFEEIYLAPQACKSRFSRGRTYPEEECEIRTVFERDRDRIIHSKAFRRLKHKTQVFLAPKGDHYRTRLTHTLEVAQIARTIARALNLNETLTEAISLGHDLGHTPFGHAGEEVLNELLAGGFRHYEQSLRVIEKLEKDGRGLNLTFEVKEGILKHSKGMGPILSKQGDRPSTLEAEIVRVSDVIAYVNHDVDDALRAGMIDLKDLPQNSKKILGETHAQRISKLVKSIIYSTREANYSGIVMEDKVLSALTELREFLFEKIYFSQSVRKEFEKAKRLVLQLFEFYDKNFENIPYFIKAKFLFPDESKERLIADYISGMTDRYAIYQYFECFVPKPWQGLEKVFGGIDYEL